MAPTIKWNDKVKLIIADVDETVADVYTHAEPDMIKEIEGVLEEGRVLFLISGSGIKGISKRIVNHIKKDLRKQIIIAHCMGAEVWGFNKEGNLLDKPFYSLYNTKLSDSQKKQWRITIKQIISEFDLKIFPTMTVNEFKQKAGDNPLAVMYEDRGPQITLELVNAYDMSHEQVKKLGLKVPISHGQYDLRILISRRAEQLFKEAGLAIKPSLGGDFALDFILKGASKTESVKSVLGNEQILSRLGLSKEIVSRPECVEVWGDKFSKTRGGYDCEVSEVLPKAVRSIDFREEDPSEFPQGYNIVIWDGEEHLHKGLLEYLKSRH
jgi:hydroxymethylpyrimidine pyrophosphatase-like HAD family hydrolase